MFSGALVKWLYSVLFVAPLWAAPPEPPNSPWFGELFEFRLNATGAYQYYKKIDTPSGSFAQTAHNAFLNGRLALSFWPKWDFATDLNVTKTAQNALGFENINFTLRYLLLDDIAGDFVSLATGGTLAIASGRFLKDFAVPLHGRANLSFHGAIGKEFLCYNSWFWSFRLWAFGGYGIANQGSPFAFTTLAFEKNWNNLTQLGTNVHFVWGLGHSNLNPRTSFRGYKNVGYKATDIEVFYQKLFCNFLTWNISYTYRLKAKNFPKHVNTLTTGLYCTFGL